jgi:uncharacterized membrane protein
VHWTGKVDFALQASMVSPTLLQNPLVGTLANATYGITTNLATAEGFEVACELPAIALEQIRSDIA